MYSLHTRIPDNNKKPPVLQKQCFRHRVGSNSIGSVDLILKGESGARQQKNHEKGKREKIPNFEMLDVLSEGLEASPAA
jgi:hypothetical protein